MCGSDGATYTSECELNVRACKEQMELRVVGQGECSKWRDACVDAARGEGARERGSEGAGEQGSEAAGERGSEGAGERGSGNRPGVGKKKRPY